MSNKVQIIFYSMYGHTYKMAEAIAEGVRSVEGIDAELYQVSELVPDDILISSGAAEAKKVFEHIPIAQVSKLPEADAIIIGTPTRFGNMASQMRNFLDQAGGVWAQGLLENKIGSVFCSTNAQHGGQESTILSAYNTLIHFGMVVVGIPFSEPGLSTMDEISGGSPYGATTIAGADGSRQPSENELALARAQGKRVAELAKKLCQ